MQTNQPPLRLYDRQVSSVHWTTNSVGEVTLVFRDNLAIFVSQNAELDALGAHEATSVAWQQLFRERASVRWVCLLTRGKQGAANVARAGCGQPIALRV